MNDLLYNKGFNITISRLNSQNSYLPRLGLLQLVAAQITMKAIFHILLKRCPG
ncbi:hypothetical protein [Pantoea allii]|uniref:hypothetical protein n=1 Tax=Pantoea allii TaxID=574096 RepID=UPI003D31B19D